MKRSKQEQEALKAAYESCIAIRDFTANIIAGTDGDPAFSDIEAHKKAILFIEWYERCAKE